MKTNHECLVIIPYKDSFNSFRYAIKIIISMGSEEQQSEAYDDLI